MGSGPNGLADKILDQLDAIAAELEVCRNRERRSELNKHAHSLKDLLSWCKTRVGYVPEGAK